MRLARIIYVKRKVFATMDRDRPDVVSAVAADVDWASGSKLGKILETIFLAEEKHAYGVLAQIS